MDESMVEVQYRSVSGGADTPAPIVTLVVPMYNVREYLDECLASILSQDLEPIQVILVDDGSTDGTAEIARGYADAYPQVEYHRIPNQGLGHARNYGARLARGEWLMFPDSDDELAPHALRDLVALGERHGCDLVTGDVVRFNASREWPNSLHRTAFRGVPELCHVTTHPSLLYDHTAWNKLFRREFFEREGLRWVEGRLYEDMPCSTPAHVLARRVAYLDRVVYRWRERDGGSPSITQRRTEAANFRDRMHAIRLVDGFFESHGVPEPLALAKDAKWLTLDIPIYLDVLPEGTDEYRGEVVGDVADYLEGVDPRAWAMAPSAERIKCRLAARRDVRGLVDFVRWCREAGDTLRIVRRGGRLYGRYPVWGLTDADCDMTDEVARSGLYTDVKSVSVVGGALVANVSALVPRLSQRRVSLAASLVGEDGAVALPLGVARHPSRRAVEVRSSKAHRTSAVRWQPLRDFTLTAPEGVLSSLTPGRYRVSLAYADGGLSCEPAPPAGPVGGQGPRPCPVRVGRSVLAVDYGPGGELTLVVREDANPVVGMGLSGDLLCLTRSDGSCDHVPLTDGGTVDLDAVPYAGEPRLLAGEAPTGGERLWLVSASREGALRVQAAGTSVAVRDCSVHGSTICFRLAWPYDGGVPAGARAWLVGDGFGARAALALGALGDGHSWVASADLSDPATASPLRDDIYRLSLEVPGEAHAYGAVLAATDSGEPSAPGGFRAIHEGGYSYSLDLRGSEPLLAVEHDRPWDEGRLRQMAVERTAYPLMRRLPLQEDLVLFESFWATSVGCSPKALYDHIRASHPEYRCVWSVRDTRIPVEGPAEVVRQGSLGYYRALARAKYLINNVNFPDYYVKRPGQVEVQTMHGTPLKTMGIDVPDEVPNEEAAERLLRTCSRWDYLVVQSKRVEEITARCFGFRKQFLRTGYPRNDALLRRNTPEEQRRLKLRMGADPDKRLVVYAPTWRARGRFDLRLDLAGLERCLGGRYDFALRRHYMALPRMSGEELLGNAIDLTYGWGVDDVMLAADVIITDYSSIMFDYALLGRPMVFFVYDLEAYRDDLRGFNLDFEAEAPGPLLRTTDEVAEALEDLEAMREQYAGRYQAFVQSFLEYESDHSCEDVFRRVFGK